MIFQHSCCKRSSLTLIIFFICNNAFSIGNANLINQDVLSKIYLPAFIALIGFLLKSFYEIIIDNRRKYTQIIEDKLKYFYWPILIRLEKDNSIWETILSKRNDPQSAQYKIADQVERNNILKNHQEILSIIDTYTYLAQPDIELIKEIKAYIKNVTIYKALRESGEEKLFPLELGAPWPDKFYEIIKASTTSYQVQLNKRKL